MAIQNAGDRSVGLILDIDDPALIPSLWAYYGQLQKIKGSEARLDEALHFINSIERLRKRSKQPGVRMPGQLLVHVLNGEEPPTA